MPVFFVHDTARGIVTPLDKKFHIRGIPATDELSETQRIHSKIQSDARDYPVKTPGDKTESADADEQATTNPQSGQSVKQFYEQTQAQNGLQLGTVKNIMSSPVLTIPLDHTLAEAWQVLQKYEIHHLVIVDRNDKLCGMLSEKTILPYLMNDESQPPDNTPLDIFCTPTLLSTGPETRIDELAPALLEHGLDGISVTENGQLMGIVTYSDILKVMLKTHAFEVSA